MARTNLVVKHVRSNARTVSNGTVIKAPDSGGLYYGEIGLNANAIDPTLFIATVANTGVTDTASTALVTNLALFKSLSWLETNVLGTTDPTLIRTLKYITDALDILVADSDAVIDSWNEVKAFLSTIPADDSYTLMSLIGGKASVNYTLGTPDATSNKAILTMSAADNTIIVTWAEGLTEAPFDIDSYATIAGASPSSYNGSWIVQACSLTEATLVSTTATGTVTTLGTISGTQISKSIKLYDDATLKTTIVPGLTEPDYSILYVDLTSKLMWGQWDAGVWTPGTLTTRTQLSTDKAVAASEVLNIYNYFGKMFTLQDTPDRIQANMDFYSIGEITAYGTSDGSGGGLIRILNTSGDLSTNLLDFADDELSGETFNAYTINEIHNRVLTLEAGNSGGVTWDAITDGFTITGGTTSPKTLTVRNTLTLLGTNGSTLNIAGGGTLGTAAFLATTAFAPYNGSTSITQLGNVSVGTWNASVISPVYGGTGIANNVNYTISLGGDILTQGNLHLSGLFNTTMNITATTNITLPTSGTVLSTDSIIDCGTY